MQCIDDDIRRVVRSQTHSGRDASAALEEAQAAVGEGTLSAVAFGRPFIANPDLVARFRQGAALAEFDPSTLYSAGAEGYTSYPELS